MPSGTPSPGRLSPPCRTDPRHLALGRRTGQAAKPEYPSPRTQRTPGPQAWRLQPLPPPQGQRPTGAHRDPPRRPTPAQAGQSAVITKEAALGEVPPEQLPDETLIYTLPSRYCLPDVLGDEAWALFGSQHSG